MSATSQSAVPLVLGLPVEFLLFAAVLAGIALLHRYSLRIALGGVLLIAAYKLACSPFAAGPGLAGLQAQLGHEAGALSNLLLLLLGFALLAQHFEDSRWPALLPRWLPEGWTGGLALLGLVFVLSSFLDNIAAAMIGGAIAHTAFRGRVHVGYLVSLVAASNAGGAGSVLGDTTTTMLWIAGIAPGELLKAYIASAVALLVCGVPASIQQHAYSPVHRQAAAAGLRVDRARLAIVALILVAAIAANLLSTSRLYPGVSAWPCLGLAVWLVILATAGWRRPAWDLLPGAARSACFLLALVLAASMMPVEQLPVPSWSTALGLGFLSAVFDNIPLTALAIEQGGHDWGVLAYVVGFGGSMVWFGSSAGVALANRYPQARSVGQWLGKGWYVVPAYVLGFATMLALTGYTPGNSPRRHTAAHGVIWPVGAIVSGVGSQDLHASGTSS